MSDHSPGRQDVDALITALQQWVDATHWLAALDSEPERMKLWAAATMPGKEWQDEYDAMREAGSEEQREEFAAVWPDGPPVEWRFRAVWRHRRDLAREEIGRLGSPLVVAMEGDRPESSIVLRRVLYHVASLSRPSDLPDWWPDVRLRLEAFADRLGAPAHDTPRKKGEPGEEILDRVKRIKPLRTARPPVTWRKIANQLDVTEATARKTWARWKHLADDS